MKKQDNVILRRIGIILGLVLLLGCFLFWPLNSYIESPGTAADLQSFVKIKGHPDRYKGSFMLRRWRFNVPILQHIYMLK